MFKCSVTEKYDLRFKPFTKKDFHFLIIVESATSQCCFSGPDKGSITSIRYNKRYLLPRKRYVSTTGWQTIPKALCTAFVLHCVWPYIAVYRLLELLQCVKINISNAFLVLPVGLRAATGSVSCQVMFWTADRKFMESDTHLSGLLFFAVRASQYNPSN